MTPPARHGECGHDSTLLVMAKAKAEALDAAQFEALVEALGGMDRVIMETPETPTEIPARVRARADEAALVALGGGDGTLGSTASALMETGLALLVIPLGTANDFARTLSVPLDPVEAARLAQTGRREHIDVGEVNGHTFFNVAGMGLSVDVAERLARGRKGLGPVSYLIATLDVLRTRRTFRARIQCDDERITVRSIQVSVGNGRRHGGGVIVHDQASIDDGLFDVYSLEPLRWWKMLALAPALMRGTHRAWRSVTTLQGRSVVVETPRRRKRVNADGELVTRTPAHFKMHRDAVRVIVPAEVESV